DANAKWNVHREELSNEMAAIAKEISIKKSKLDNLMEKMSTYMKRRERIDSLSEKINLYQLYEKITNSQCLPYEILKKYLPLVEQNINRILHEMVAFSIIFKYTTGKKSIDTIDIYMCYPEKNPRPISNASGFEGFIINLAVRMTLCQISL